MLIRDMVTRETGELVWHIQQSHQTGGTAWQGIRVWFAWRTGRPPFDGQM